MRLIIGSLIVCLCLPIFWVTLESTATELQNVESISNTINRKVKIRDVHLEQNSSMYDRNGTLIGDIINEENRVFVPSTQIPAIVKDIFVTTEDERFYLHKGFDVEGITRAALTNAQSQGISQGGSTITQQLVRNVFLTQERTYNRKILELFYAYRMESQLTKDEILELYLNAIYFSNGAYGVGTAANYYFNKPLQSLSLAQLSFICAVPNNPTVYNPLRKFKNVKKRQVLILRKLLKAEKITIDQYNKATKEKIVLNLREKTSQYPDYTTYVLDEFKDLVYKYEGFAEKVNLAPANQKKAVQDEFEQRVQSLLKSGIKIHTALRPTIQEAAVNAVESRLAYNDIQGSLAVIDHTSHEVVALSGGKDYKKFEFNRAYQAYRQPGSAIKPLLVYAPYIDTFNVTPYHQVDASAFCKGDYCPQNFGNAIYGVVSLERALKWSYNTPAVRLLDELGVQRGFSYLKKFKFAKVAKDDEYLSAAVGGFAYGMTPLELTNAYTTFSNGGAYQPSHAITKVTDENNKTLFAWQETPVQVWSNKTNDTMRYLLNKVVTAGTAQRSYFDAEYIGGKTGTTNDFKDLWFAGLTDRFTCAVWVGKDRPESIEYIDLSQPQQKIWRDVMEVAQQTEK